MENYLESETLGANTFKYLNVPLSDMGYGKVGLWFTSSKHSDWDYHTEYEVAPSQTKNVMMLIRDTSEQSEHIEFGIARISINGD